MPLDAVHSIDTFELEAIAAPAAVLCLVDESSFIYVAANRQHLDLIRRSEDDVLGRTPDELIPKPAAAEMIRTLGDCRQMRLPQQFEFALEHDRQVKWYRQTVLPLLDSAGHATRFFVTSLDITEQKKVELASSEDQARVLAIVNGAYEAIITVDRSHTVKFVNGGAERMFGYAAHEIIGKPLAVLLPERYHQNHTSYVNAFTHSPVHSREMQERSEVYGLRRNGEEFRAQISISRISFRSGFELTAIIRDVSQTATLITELEVTASTDYLTGIPNRRGLMKALSHEVERARRYRRQLALLAIDIDHFKAVNDTYGHPVGDEAIRTVAQYLKETCRHADRVGRFGGEEFIMILPETSLDCGVKAGERIREAMAAHSIPDGRGGAFKLTVSIGVAEVDSAAPSVDQLLQNADTALYEAKRFGRDQVRAFGQRE